MSVSNQTYKELAIPYFKEVFDCIDSVMIKLKVPYYLIGATAVALNLLRVFILILLQKLKTNYYMVKYKLQVKDKFSLNQIKQKTKLYLYT